MKMVVVLLLLLLLLLLVVLLCGHHHGGLLALILQLQHNNYLCTYDLYSPVHNVLDACISIIRASGRGLGPGIREFFGPCEMASSR